MPSDHLESVFDAGNGQWAMYRKYSIILIGRLKALFLNEIFQIEGRLYYTGKLHKIARENKYFRSMIKILFWI